MKKQLFAGITAAFLLLSAGCGKEDNTALPEDASMLPGESFLQGQESGNKEDIPEDIPENNKQDSFEDSGNAADKENATSKTLHFFTLEESAILLAPQTESGEGTFGLEFAATAVDGMEYAALDCSFFDGTDVEMTADFLENCPEITSQTKLFLRRKQGEGAWEAAVLPEVSGGERDSARVVFPSKENGMIVLDGESGSVRICITQDGGDTWTLAGMPDSMAGMNGIYCVYARGEGNFFVGYRYKYLPETGIVYMTQDNGQSWNLLELPKPDAGELRYGYSEPMRIWEESGKLFIKMRARAEDIEAAARGEFGGYEAYYELASVNGGETWEMVKAEGKLDFQLRTD